MTSPGRAADAAFDRNAQLLFRPEGLEDPFPVYRELRESRPVGWTHALEGGCWLITSYRLVAKALRADTHLSMEQGLAPKVELREDRKEEYKAFVNFVSHSMLVRDGKPHRRLRSMVTRALSHSAVQAKESRVRRIVEELLDPFRDRHELDLVDSLAHPLPVAVIAEILGLPQQDLGRLRKWADEMTVFLGGGADAQAKVPAALASTLAMTRYFEEQMERLRKTAGEGLIQDLLRAQTQGDPFKDKEIRAQCMLLFIAGHQTTSDLLSSCLWQLVRHPEVLGRVARNPDLIPAAIEESLRYDGPVQMAGRIATQTFELGGERIAAGERVFLLLGAANRDPEQFDEPDRFVVPRSQNRHLAFGTGPHQCPGERLGRLEARVALEVLLERMPNLRATADSAVRDLNAGFRRILSLPVAWG